MGIYAHRLIDGTVHIRMYTCPRHNAHADVFLNFNGRKICESMCQ